MNIKLDNSLSFYNDMIKLYNKYSEKYNLSKEEVSLEEFVIFMIKQYTDEELFISENNNEYLPIVSKDQVIQVIKDANVRVFYNIN
jgi:hypothetical protein